MFSSYLEGTMDSPLRVAFEQHLADCPSCKASYDRYHAAVLMLEEWSDVDPPAALHESIMAGVERARVATPKPVKWWRIDWQHVFTIRVPARAAALGVAALLLVTAGVQLTPLGPMVGDLVGIRQRSASTPVTYGNGGYANPWRPAGAGQKAGDTGLSVSVAAVRGGAYDIRLSAMSDKPVAFSIDTGSKTHGGVVARNQDTVIHVAVPPANGSTAVNLNWRYANTTYEELVLLPAKFDVQSARKTLSFDMQGASVREILRKVSEVYGVVVIASGDLEQRVAYAGVHEGNPKDALYQCLEPVGMKSNAATDSIYVVEPLR